MKTLNFKPGTWNLRWVVVALFLIACNDGAAQIQQAWVAKYNNGITNGTNQAVKMALDNAGNIYITGFSQNTNGNLDYATIKYAPNGNQLWVARLDSTNTTTAKPAGLVLDASNNIIVTGSAVTVKYDTSGNQMWTAPYAGTSLATDANGNICVVGFSTDFGTVKLSPAGSNLWQASYPSSLGPNMSQVVAIDSNGNVDVAGNSTWLCDRYYCYLDLLLVKYDSNGHQLWTAENIQGSENSVQVEGMALDNANSACLLVDSEPAPYPRFTTFKYDANGNSVWTSFNPTDNGGSVAHGIALDTMSNTFVTGADAHYSPNTPFPIGTYKIGVCSMIYG
jgi:hypothetical protein